MSEKIEEKVVSGIATRRKSGEREREILLIKDSESKTWGLPEIVLGLEEEGSRPLMDYFSEEIVGRKARITNAYNQFIPNGEIPRRTIETYLVTVRGRVNRERKGVRWFDEGRINRQDYPITKVAKKIIDVLRKDNYL